MLTNLTFLNTGEKWPPTCEHERLEMYAKNKMLFEAEHAKVYENDLRRIERIVGNFSEIVSYPVILNFQKLMSLKIADLLIGKPPLYKAGKENSKEQLTINSINEVSELQGMLHKAIIDVSRFGDGLLRVRLKNGSGIISCIQPSIWFPIVNPDDVGDIINHVLAWEYTEMHGMVKKTFLKAQIHYKGYYDELICELMGGRITSSMPGATVQTNLSDFAIIQISNIITSDRITGIDDYTDIDSIISEIMVRVGQISKILDKHAMPSMSGPASALEQNYETGEYKFKVGNYFPRNDNEDPKPEYIVWEAQLVANFTQIEKLVNMLYTISEMGSAIFGDMAGSTGQVASGTALRRLMISPLAKADRIRMKVDAGAKKAIYLCSELGGTGIVDLNKFDISIIWQDSLPSDKTEEALVIEKRTGGGKSTMSQKRVLMQYDGLSEDDADEELARIQDEEAEANPIVDTPFTGGEESTPPEVI